MEMLENKARTPNALDTLRKVTMVLMAARCRRRRPGRQIRPEVLERRKLGCAAGGRRLDYQLATAPPCSVVAAICAQRISVIGIRYNFNLLQQKPSLMTAPLPSGRKPLFVAELHQL
jgi:hypothetical protein